MSKIELKNCQFKCPKCACTEGDAISSEGNEEDGTFEITFWCGGCGCQFIELYDMIYKGSYIELDNG